MYVMSFFPQELLRRSEEVVEFIKNLEGGRGKGHKYLLFFSTTSNISYYEIKQMSYKEIILKYMKNT